MKKFKLSLGLAAIGVMTAAVLAQGALRTARRRYDRRRNPAFGGA